MLIVSSTTCQIKSGTKKITDVGVRRYSFLCVPTQKVLRLD